MSIERVLADLETVVRETFSLWDHNRVGFQWRHYTWNHTKRVQAMCLALGRREGGDLDKLAVAALLHDITKRYDGNILTDETGQRKVDEFGFWQNETLLPARENAVTRYYHEANLYGKVHSYTGACVARKLLASYGLPQEFIQDVAAIIEAHVKPVRLPPDELARLYEPIERQIISDADTMDANVGYVALYRNIHIHSYFMIQRTGRFDVREYIASLGSWIERKQPFADQLFTASARQIAQKRQERKRSLLQQLQAELDGNFSLHSRYGLVGMIAFFVSGVEDPNLTTQLQELQRSWIPQRRRQIETEEKPSQREQAWQALARVEEFAKTLACEVRAEM